MLGETEFDFDSREYEGKDLDALTTADVKRLLTMETTTVEVRSGEDGGLILPQVGGRQTEIVRPRCRVMEPSLNPEDAYLEVRFGVCISVPSSEFVPHISTEEVGPGGMNPTLSDEEPRSAADVIEDDAEDADDDDEVETKHVLDADGSITEVRVDADEEQPADQPESDNQ